MSEWLTQEEIDYINSVNPQEIYLKRARRDSGIARKFLGDRGGAAGFDDALTRPRRDEREMREVMRRTLNLEASVETMVFIGRSVAEDTLVPVLIVEHPIRLQNAAVVVSNETLPNLSDQFHFHLVVREGTERRVIATLDLSQSGLSPWVPMYFSPDEPLKFDLQDGELLVVEVVKEPPPGTPTPLENLSVSLNYRRRPR